MSKLLDMDVDYMWFQQDGATCHPARETIQLLHRSFSGSVISRFGDENWPARSCDLTPLDFLGFFSFCLSLWIMPTSPHVERIH